MIAKSDAHVLRENSLRIPNSYKKRGRVITKVGLSERVEVGVA